MKKQIIELCMKTAMKEGVKCEAYFSNVHTTGYKVCILYSGTLYKFKRYKDALNFLSS